MDTGNERLLLTAAVGAGKPTIDAGYEIDKVCASVKFKNQSCFDTNTSDMIELS